MEDIDGSDKLKTETTEDLKEILQSLKGKAERKYGLPNRVLVGMNEGEAIILGEKEELLTYGAGGGCNIVAIEGRVQDEPFGILTHYDPIAIRLNVFKIHELAKKLGGKKSVREARAEIFARGEWVKKKGEWTMTPEDRAELKKLSAAVKRNFGKKTSLKISLFDEEVEVEGGAALPNTVIVNIDPETPPDRRILTGFKTLPYQATLV